MSMLTAKAGFDKIATQIAYAYLTLPVLIFTAGWLRWYYSVAIIGVVVYSAVLSVHQHSNYLAVNLHKHKKKITWVIAIIFLWLVSSGIGGLWFQTDDHYARNEILRHLVNYDWPVIYNFTKYQPHDELRPGNYMLVYYIGYWMPAALVGKVLGWHAANAFLFLWTMLGLLLVFYFISRYIKKLSLTALFIFIFFSGMDVVPHLLQGSYFPILHLEWWSGNLQYSSNTTLLYWVFNQTIVPWLAVAMVLNKMPVKNLVFVAALTFFYAPFPTIGLIPFIIYFIFSEKRVPVAGLLQSNFSFQNIAGATVVFLMLLGYYTSSNSQQNFNFYDTTFLQYLIFVSVEFLLVALVLFVKSDNKRLLLFTIICLLIFPLFQFRETPDFTMRASLPALFVLMMLLINFLVRQHTKKYSRNILVALLLIGAITPANEMMSSAYFTGKYWYYYTFNKSKLDYTLRRNGTLFRNTNPLVTTIVGDTQHSFFYKHFCKRAKQ